MQSNVVFKRAYVYNIDTDATSKDLSDVLGFNKTDFLKKHCCVEIKTTENDGKFALVVSPSFAHEEVLKLNGIDFYGQKLRIVSEDEPEDPRRQNLQAATPTNDDGEILYMLLDCRNHPDLNFPPVREIEVCDALMLDHAEDVHKAVKKFWGKNLGTFGIESTDMDSYVDTSVVIRGHSIKLEPVRRRQKRQIFRDPDGIKIRIYDAYGLQYRGINGGLFDDYFNNFGVEIIKQTQPERCQERREFYNTNRFIVVKKTNIDGVEVDFGAKITVSGHTFKLWYPGMKKFCDLCNGIHKNNYCPSRVRFAFEQQLRKGKTQQRKVYSDSTLRHANQLALTTDVACMSGGGLGQICNLIPHDEPHDEVIINAGTNEVKNEQPLNEFIYTVEKAGDKLKELSKSTPVTVVLPQINNTTPELHAKSDFLRDYISKLDDVRTIKLENIATVSDDPHHHPTVNGTKTILDQINDHFKNEIILQNCDDHIALPTKYRQVQPVFKAGCRGCNSSEFTQTLCLACKDNAKDVDTKKLEEAIEVVRDEMFPRIDVPDVDMRNANLLNKRGISPSHDDLQSASKAAKGSEN